MLGMYCPPCAEREFHWRPALGMRTGYVCRFDGPLPWQRA